MHDALGDRMKEYEKAWNIMLPRRLPVIIRLDGKNFHSLTRSMEKPFDQTFISYMQMLGLHLCASIQTTQFAYIQSDEISLLLHNYKRLTTEPYFNNEVQKIVSVAAGIASSFFSHLTAKSVVFDARVFILPEAEVTNYFVWRQKDATRNSINSTARSLMSHKECQGKSIYELQEEMFKRGTNWDSLPTTHKRGSTIIRPGMDNSGWVIDNDIPIFTNDRGYIESYLMLEEE